MGSTDLRTPRATVITVLVALPAVLAAAAWTATQAYHLISPAGRSAGAASSTFAQAITRGDGVERVYAYIHAGQDPNLPIRIDDPDYTGGGTVTVSPLLAAIAARDETVVLMLLDYGTRLDLPQHRAAVCVAAALGHGGTAALIARRAPALPSACPELTVDPDAPLAWALASTP